MKMLDSALSCQTLCRVERQGPLSSQKVWLLHPRWTWLMAWKMLGGWSEPLTRQRKAANVQRMACESRSEDAWLVACSCVALALCCAGMVSDMDQQRGALSGLCQVR